jgi:hypothetical protein
MRYVLASLLAGFSLVGLTLLFAGIRGLWSTARRRALLLSAVGEVIKVEMEHQNLSDSGTVGSVYTPVLRFTTASGEVKTFRSAFGFGPTSPYRVGMTIPVLYDGDDVIPPMIDSWTTIWAGHIALIDFGVVLLGCAASFVYAVFVLHVFPRQF